MTKAPGFLLATLVVLWGVIIFAVVSPADVYPGAATHPQHKAMHVAGPATDFDAKMLGSGTMAGVLIISIFLLCLLLGSGKNGATPQFITIVVVASSLLIGVFLKMSSTIRDYIAAPSPEIAGGFPTPTAWMVFGISMTPMVFLLIYVAGFRRWVMTDDDRKQLEALVAQQKAAGEIDGAS